ncbi:hypothetical protein [Thermococcus sp.]|uniref:hypothetical protein n=1 Tax=Thermococcus sp. TaxID=35749 RepID=UPI0026361F6F|nr:hypothetical protein [Thermococcus sp.]
MGFECDDVRFDFKDRAYRATLSCRVYLYNPTEKNVAVRDVTVVNKHYSLGDLEDVPLGSLNVGKWSVNPESFDLSPQGVETVNFKLPLEISSWAPISIADATEVVSKDGKYVMISFNYSLGYSYDGSEWNQLHYEVQTTVKVTMDAKTVAADYLLSGFAAVVDPNTAISFQIGSMRVSGIRLSLKLGFDPVALLWNGWFKPWILEHT